MKLRYHIFKVVSVITIFFTILIIILAPMTERQDSLAAVVTATGILSVLWIGILVNVVDRQ